MHRWPSCLLLVLLAAGCGGPPSHPANPSAPRPSPVYVPRTAPATQPVVTRPAVPTKAEPTKATARPSTRDQWKRDQDEADKVLYQGQPASFWVQLIYDRDLATRNAGERALIALGEAALPALAEAIVSASRDARITARVCFIEIRSRKGIEYLRQAIREGKPESHGEIAFALAWTTRGDRSVLPDDDFAWADKVLRETRETESLGKLHERRRN